MFRSMSATSYGTKSNREILEFVSNNALLPQHHVISLSGEYYQKVILMLIGILFLDISIVQWLTRGPCKV